MEIVRRLNALFNRGDREAVVPFYDPDVEWRDLQHAPDTAETVRGVSALQTLWDQWAQAFSEFSAEIDEYIDAGECVVAVTHWRATGTGSGLSLDLTTADVYEFAGGKVVRVTLGYADKNAALKAAALEA